MQIFRFCIKPLSAFGSRLLGETLFGQCCWMIALAHGNDKLESLLESYRSGKPFAVISDAFPSGFVPFPTVPLFFFERTATDPKQLKSIEWMPVNRINEPFEKWQSIAFEAKQTFNGPLSKKDLQMHNTIMRSTGTTGTNEFAPFSADVCYYKENVRFDIYVGIDEELVSLDMVKDALIHVGRHGYGKDATTGLGKFEVTDVQPTDLAFGGPVGMTLASGNLSATKLGEYSFYKTRTHFGRHGSLMATSGQPFKKPILLATSGAVLSLPEASEKPFVGQAVCGISAVQPNAVHQGYALLLNIANFNPPAIPN